MSRRRGYVLLAGLFATTLASVISACAGLGLPPAAPVSTPGQASTSAPATVPSGTAVATPTTPAGQSPTGAATTTAATPATPGTQGASSTPPDPAQSTGPSPSDVPDTVARMTGGNGSAVPLLVPTSALPSGWTATPARDTRGYRMTVCGVDLEPTEAVDGAQQNWQGSAAGPYLEQHVRVYPDATATTVVAGLAKKIPGCTSYTAKDGKGKSTFAVQKLSLKGAPSGTVAWRQRVNLTVPAVAAAPSGTASPAPAPSMTTRTVEVVQDVAVRRVGAAVLLFNAYAVEKEPDDAVLVTALTSVG